MSILILLLRTKNIFIEKFDIYAAIASACCMTYDTFISKSHTHHLILMDMNILSINLSKYLKDKLNFKCSHLSFCPLTPLSPILIRIQMFLCLLYPSKICFCAIHHLHFMHLNDKIINNERNGMDGLMVFSPRFDFSLPCVVYGIHITMGSVLMLMQRQTNKNKKAK